jgi:hypothetical protein
MIKTENTFSDLLVSDLHKDARGGRPREGFWAAWNSYSDAEKQAEWDSLIRELESSMEDDARQEAFAIASFEKAVAASIAIGAGTRETAIRWVVESLNLSDSDKMYGADYVCYLLGLPYKFQAEFKDAI